MIFPLVQDFADVLASMPLEHLRQRILKLLDEAIRRDVHFIDRHPTTFFQCMWNTCWWYDCPEAAGHYEDPAICPWEQSGTKLADLLHTWHEAKAQAKPGQPWIRSLPPPALPLGSAQRAVLAVHEGKVNGIAVLADGSRVVSGGHDQTSLVLRTRLEATARLYNDRHE